MRLVLAALALTTACTSSDDGLPPVARAGDDQSVSVGEAVGLDGSASTDADGSVTGWAWSVLQRPEGAEAELDDPASPTPTLTPDVEGTWLLALVVTDDDGLRSAPDVVGVTAWDTDAAPVAVLVADTADGPEVGAAITLDGSGSSDPEGDPLTYAFTVTLRPPGAEAEVAHEADDAPTATLVPDAEGLWIASLVVSDGTHDSRRADVLLDVRAAGTNQAPVADAGPDQALDAPGEAVTLDGSGSADPDGDALTYAWRFATLPADSALGDADISGADAAVAGFTPDVTGSYTVALEVCDPQGLCDEDEALVEVGTVTNHPPDCTAGPDQSVALGDTVTLDASASSDPDGDALSFGWMVTGAPSGATATVDDPTSAVTTLTPDVAGTWHVSVWVTDGTDTCYDNMRLDVTGANEPPVADAGADQRTCGLDAVELDGTGSSDPDGDPLTYAWSFSAVPAGSALTDADISGATTATASFVPDVEGTWELTLTVGDGTTTATDTTTVEVGTSDAVVMLHLDEGSGTTAADASGAGHDATLSGAAGWGGGRFFSGLELGGSGGAVVADADDLDLADAFTIDFWMRVDTLASDWQVVLAKGDPANYALWLYEDVLTFEGTTVDGDAVTAGGTTSAGDGAWHHYAVVVDAGTVTLYEDGAAFATGTVPADLQGNGDDLTIGHDGAGAATWPFTGAIDELVIRSTASTGADVGALASATSQECTGDADTTAPAATITSPADGDAVSGAYARVEGTAADDSAVVAVTVNGIDAVATSTGFATWVAWVPLDAGSTAISVDVEDVAGNVATAADAITVGSDPPDCTDGVALLLPFDEDASGVAADRSPNGLDGTDAGTGRLVGAFGNAASFDGASATTTVPDDAALDLAGDFTIDFWYRRDGPSADWEFIAIKGSAYNYAAVVRGDDVGFSYMDTASGAWAVYATGFNDGDWHHVAAVLDGTTLSLYVDGALEDATTTSGTPVTNTDDLVIGGLGAGYYNFAGDLDQFRIFDQALTATEVADLYAAGEACAAGDLLSAAATATASSEWSSTYSADHVIDGDTTEVRSTDTTMWLLADATTGWVQLDLGDQVGVTGLRWVNTHNRLFRDRATTDYRVLLSPTGSFKGEEVTLATGTGTMESTLVFHDEGVAAPVAGRYLRLAVDGYTGSGGGINEIEVLGVE